MLKMVLAAALAVMAMPAQAAEMFTIKLSGDLAGAEGYLDPQTGEMVETPIERPNAVLSLTGNWEDGFNSYLYPCNYTGCLKAAFQGNEIVFQTPEYAFGCHFCSESIRLTFDRPVNRESAWLVDGFVGGTYEFSGGARYSYIYVRGNITAAVFPEMPAIPEPATWVMMIAGFGMIGGALRRHCIVARTACSR